MDAIVAANTIPRAQVAAAPAGTPGYPTDGNADTGVLPTDFPAYHYAGVILEILNVIEGAGLTPDRNNTGQLLAAIEALAAGPNSAETLARIAADNAEAAARANGDAVEAAARTANINSVNGAILGEANSRINGDAVEAAARSANVAALVADLAGYLPLGGGTLSGQLIVNNSTYSTGYNLVCATNGNYHPSNSAVTGFSASETETNIYNATGSALLLGVGLPNNIVNFYYQGTYIAGISTDGASIMYGTTSDYRLKVNVVPIADGLARVKSVPVHRFAWGSRVVEGEPDPIQVDGFMAHEAALGVPEAVLGAKDATKTYTDAVMDPQGGIVAEGVTEADFTTGMAAKLPSYPAGSQWSASITLPIYQVIDQAKMVPVLWAAVQELAGVVEGLVANMAALRTPAGTAPAAP